MAARGGGWGGLPLIFPDTFQPEHKEMIARVGPILRRLSYAGYLSISTARTGPAATLAARLGRAHVFLFYAPKKNPALFPGI